MKRQKDWTIAYHKQIFDDYGRPAGMSSWVSLLAGLFLLAWLDVAGGAGGSLK